MGEGNEVRRITGVKFVANVNIEGDYSIKQMLLFRDRLYLLIERPDSTPELYYIDEDKKQCNLVEFEGLRPINYKGETPCQIY